LKFLTVILFTSNLDLMDIIEVNRVNLAVVLFRALFRAPFTFRASKSAKIIGVLMDFLFDFFFNLYIDSHFVTNYEVIRNLKITKWHINYTVEKDYK